MVLVHLHPFHFLWGWILRCQCVESGYWLLLSTGSDHRTVGKTINIDSDKLRNNFILCKNKVTVGNKIVPTPLFSAGMKNAGFHLLV